MILYIARDKDGDIYGYQYEPKRRDNDSGEWLTSKGKAVKVSETLLELFMSSLEIPTWEDEPKMINIEINI